MLEESATNSLNLAKSQKTKVVHTILIFPRRTTEMNTKNECIFRTPDDWGTVTGALLRMDHGKYAYHKIDPEPSDLEFVTEE